MSAHWDGWVGDTLETLEQQKLLRTIRPLRTHKSATEAWVSEDNLRRWQSGQLPTMNSGQLELKRLRLFSTNDYLGLSSHPDVCQAAARASVQMGMGPRASAIVAGYSQEHQELEAALAQLKATEDCLLLPSGFAANMSVLSVLGGQPDVAIFSDELNHASIIDGARLAVRDGSRLHVYRHNDLQHLAQLLESSSVAHCRKLVVTDSLFSMDGDFADLQGLVQLKHQHGFLLVVDDAHATLVCGEHGGGAAQMLGVEHEIDVTVGTLSKAFGALGGFVATSRSMKQLLLNRGRSFVYSTALPVPVVAAAHAALRASQREPWRRRHVWQLTERLGAALGLVAESPIVPLIIGDAAHTMQLGSDLLGRGFHVPAIRPPTVPQGSSRLRISLSAEHSVQDVDDLVAAIQDCCSQLKPLPQQQHTDVSQCKHLFAKL